MQRKKTHNILGVEFPLQQYIQRDNRISLKWRKKIICKTKAVHDTPRKLDVRSSTRHILIELLNVKYKEKNPSDIQAKKQNTYK